MANTKKFGTFGGVFTPSILTILGVIMYLRLGWIVGQLGFYYMLALIVIAHIISVSTGLSLSSIATDKKIKVGGIYYMLSRSLGLAMGGSIGITIFLATALSISLYVVGFVESFLGIPAIADFLHMTGNVNNIRLIGTVVIVILIIIAYISTSIAIKTQFFILAAIFVSLISVIVGAFIHPEFQASTPSLLPINGAEDMMVLFAVFFPAATGFTAGVAMSGDLKSPRKSIPTGTLLAIGVGLVVYIVLAAVFAFLINRDLLLNDTNFLLKIAWWSPLVIAGIWGATLSSALGGILGAPRILQAMSADSVTPQYFAKGVGATNEPRRALIFSFLLAEAGILIGSLDAIAGIVTMFYIAAYGFINLAYVLERWANTDFRPNLKIPIWVGILGFVASIGVMIKLDTIGMIAAFLIMFAIYVFLRRKQVQGNMTDVWQSVWTSVVRSSLNKIDQKPLSQVNWQPNIILFSGGGKVRPHLLELGIDIAGKQGFLSNFDLLIQKEASVLFPKSQQKLQTKENTEYTGVFTRRQAVRDLYEGIEMIAQTYGFSGVEPNTVMMGWAKESKNPIRFTQMIHKLSTLDMNVLLLDYDKHRGWGRQQTIDIWWEEGSKHGNLALSLVKFITLSEHWHQAQVRLLIVNPKNEKQASLYAKATDILNEIRFKADVRIINNELEQRSFYDIIQIESINTDLVFIGFPTTLVAGREQQFVDTTNSLCEKIGTVAIIHASSQFKALHCGEEAVAIPDFSALSNKLSVDKLNSKAVTEGKAELLPYQRQLFKDVQSIAEKYISSYPTLLSDQNRMWTSQLNKAINKAFDYLNSRASNQNKDLFPKIVAAQLHIFFKGQINFIQSHESQNFNNKISFTELSQSLIAFQKSIYRYPYRVKSNLSKLEYASIATSLPWHKQLEYKSLLSLSNPIPYYIHLRELLLNHYPNALHHTFLSNAQELQKQQMQHYSQRILLLQKIRTLIATCAQKPDDLTWQAFLLQEKDKALSAIAAFQQQLEQQIEETVIHFRQSEFNGVKNCIDMLQIEAPNRFLNLEQDNKLHAKKSFKKLIEKWEQLIDNQNLAFGLWQLNLTLLDFYSQTQSILSSFLKNTLQDNEQLFSTQTDKLKWLLEQAQEPIGADENNDELIKQITDFSSIHEIQIQQQLIDEYNRILQKIKSYETDMPEQLTIYANISASTQIQEEQKIDIAARKTLEYIVEREMANIRKLIIDYGQNSNSNYKALKEIAQNILVKINNKNHQTEYTKSNNTIASIKLKDVVDTNLEQLAGIQQRWKKISHTYHISMQKQIAQFGSFLELYPFIREVEHLKQYLRAEKKKEWMYKYAHKSIQNIKASYIQQIDKLIALSHSNWLVHGNKPTTFLEKETRVENLLELNNRVRPTPEVLTKLPDFYKQLFLHKEFYLNELWVERPAENLAFQCAVQRWKNTYNGGVLVLGERHMGKSFFINKMIEKHAPSDNIYQIQAPYTGSVSTDVFLSALQKATEIHGSYAKIFNLLPKQSVIVIDDLELWWEKSETGMAVIQHIYSLINRFGKQHLFIISCNGYAYNLINKYQKIDNIFLGIIELKAFNTNQLKQLIMKRHLSTNLSLSIGKHTQTNISQLQYSRLFSNLLHYSEGKPGVALQAWITAIQSVDDKHIHIAKLNYPNIDILDALEPDWLAFIIHFVLHKRMNLAKLIRVSRESRSQVILRLRVLKRAGILIETGDDIIDINPYLLPFLRSALIKREFI